MQVNAERRAPERPGPTYVVFGEFVCQHYCCRTDLDLGMTDASAWLLQAKQFFGTESAFIKSNGRWGVVNAQIGEDLMNSVHGNLLDGDR
jgi:hypothetical protein